MKKLFLLSIMLLMGLSSPCWSKDHGLLDFSDILNEAYSASWSGITDRAPSAAVLYDKIETLGTVSEYKTIWIPANQMTPTATNGATASTEEFATNDINKDYYVFPLATTRYTEFEYTMPKTWDETTLKAKFEWKGASGCSAGDTVTIGIAAKAENDGDAYDQAMGTYVDVQDTALDGADGDKHRTSVSGTITPSGTPTAGGTLHFKLRRTISDTGMAESLHALRVGLQYKITSAEPAW